MESKYRSHKDLVNEAIADKDTFLVLVMGETRSGKTKLVNLISDSGLMVGNGLKSCTRHIQLSHPYVDDEGDKTILIDTPGLNNTARDDTEILQEVASFLVELYKHGKNLKGIIYVQSLSGKWKTAASLRNFTLFSKLCGSAAMTNVVVATTVREGMGKEARSILEAQLVGPGWCLKQWIDEDGKNKREAGNKNDSIPGDESPDNNQAGDENDNTTEASAGGKDQNTTQHRVKKANNDKSSVENSNKSEGGDQPENQDGNNSDSEDAGFTVISHKDQATAREIIAQVWANDEMPLAIQTELYDDKKTFEETELGTFLRHGAPGMEHGTPGMESILYEQEKQLGYLTVEINKLRAELTGQKMGWGYPDHSQATYKHSYPGHWGEGATSLQPELPCNLCGEMTIGAAPICFECSNSIFWYYHHSPETYPGHYFTNTAYWQPRHYCCLPHPAYHVPPFNPYGVPQHGAFASHHRFSTSGSTCAPDH